MLRINRLILLLLLMLFCYTASAVINPALQPDVYYQNYDNVVVLEVAGIDAGAGTINCTVQKVIKGTYYPLKTAITVTFTGDMAAQVGERERDGSLKKGYVFPVFAGKPSRRKKTRQLRMYADTFYVGEIKAKDQWHIGLADGTEKDSEGKLINTLAGSGSPMFNECTCDRV